MYLVVLTIFIPYFNKNLPIYNLLINNALYLFMFYNKLSINPKYVLLNYILILIDEDKQLLFKEIIICLIKF